MGINSIGSAWQANLRTTWLPGRDNRLYIDPRGFEYPDLGTGSAQYSLAREENLIDRGNCELGIAPMIFDETVPATLRATTERSNDVSHTGDYSYKFTKTSAPGGGDAFVGLTDTFGGGDLHGMVAGSTYSLTFWVYISTASGIDPSTEAQYWVIYSGGSVNVFAADILDAWQLITLDFTLPSDAQDAYFLIGALSAAPANSYYYDDVKLTTHNVPGSHYLSDGYIECLTELPDTFTLQIKFKPNFAFNTGSNQNVYGYSAGVNQYFYIYYRQADDVFWVHWKDGGTNRYLISAQYDNGTTHRNINQWITLTAAIDLTTGTTAGSSLWLDKTQDDTTWSGNIDSKTTEFNKMQIRAYNGTEGDYDIAYVRFFPNYVATDADVQNDFKDVKDEEIYWSLDGHGTGRTRVNVSDYLLEAGTYRGLTGAIADTHGANTASFTLRNYNGEFSDDQNAAFDAANSVYNGTNAQNYLQRRFGVIYESWYSGDFDTVFKGRMMPDGLSRESFNKNISYARIQCEDGIAEIDESIERNGRVSADVMFIRSNTLIDRGSCEKATPDSGTADVNNAPPAIAGELSVTKSNALFVRSTAQIYQGRYSYLFTVDGAADTWVDLQDALATDDLHGLIAGNTYTFRAKVYIPSGALTGTEVVLAIGDYHGAAWSEDTQAATNNYDVWQQVEVSSTLNAAATGIYIRLHVLDTAVATETFYVKDIELIPADLSECTSRSIFHNIAHRSDHRYIQYLANNSFENATIGNSWLVTAGGTLNKDAADGFFGSASGELIPGVAAERMYQTVLFTGTKKLNVGETYTFYIWLKSTAAASAADNVISIVEFDGAVQGSDTLQAYTLAGGEGYKKVEVSRTITDADTDRLRCDVSAAAGDTINIDGAMLIQSDRALDYFEVNATDGASGVVSADVGVEIDWPWYGIDAGNVDYSHPYRRVDIGSTMWQHLKSIGNSFIPRYLGMTEAGTLKLMAVLDKDYSEPVPRYLTGDSDFRHNIVVNLDPKFGNRLYGTGIKIVKDSNIRLAWSAAGSGNFTPGTGNQLIDEDVIDDGYWPDPNEYGEYWAEYGTPGKFEYVITPHAKTFELMMQVGRERKGFHSITFIGVTRSKADNIIGLDEADLMHTLSDTGGVAGTFTEEDIGYGATGLDPISRPGQARILLRNETGATKTIIDAGIIGKPIYRFSGAEGYIHDSYIDYESIAKHGEMPIEFGGDDIVDGRAHGQLDRLADFYWKNYSDRKHRYTLPMVGNPYDIGPDLWFRLDAGEAGTAENIDSTAEVVEIRTEQVTGSLGSAQLVLRELQEKWKPDSNAIARFQARGVPVIASAASQTVVISSEYVMKPGNYRVPIGNTSAETYINSAIDFLNGGFGGGTVILTEGVFKIAAPIVMKANTKILGSGSGTVIEKNCNDNAIECEGGAGTEVENVGLEGFRITRNASDTNANNSFIYFNYVDKSTIKDIILSDSYWDGIKATNCDDLIVNKITLTGYRQNGLLFTTCDALRLSEIVVDNENTSLAAVFAISASGTGHTISDIIIRKIDSSADGFTAFNANAPNSTISNIRIEDVDCDNPDTIGLLVTNDGIDLSAIRVDNVDNSFAAASSYGIKVTGSDNTLTSLVVDNCSGTGVLIDTTADATQIHSGRSTSNGTNYLNTGTNTTAAVEDT